MATEQVTFYILCGKKYDRYLEVNPFGGVNRLSGVKDKNKASFFRVEKESNGSYFLTSDFEDGDEKFTLYMSGNPEEPSDETEWSLQMGGDEPIEFTLHHPGPDGDVKDATFWKTNPCYVKVGKKYVGYDMEENMLVIAEDCSDEEIWMMCKIEELPAGQGGMHAPGGPKPTRKTPLARRNKPKRVRAQFGSE